MLTEETKQRIKNYLRLDELSPETLGRYIKSANKSGTMLGRTHLKSSRRGRAEYYMLMRKSRNREQSVNTAVDKLTKNARVSAKDNLWKVTYTKPGSIGTFSTTYKNYANEQDVENEFKENNPSYKIADIVKL